MKLIDVTMWFGYYVVILVGYRILALCCGLAPQDAKLKVVEPTSK